MSEAKTQASKNTLLFSSETFKSFNKKPDEFAAGHFKTAVNIPVDQLEDKIKTLPADKPIVFVCGTGARSGESYYMVKDVRPEMKNVYYLEGYLTFKKDASFEITKEPTS